MSVGSGIASFRASTSRVLIAGFCRICQVPNDKENAVVSDPAVSMSTASAVICSSEMSCNPSKTTA